MTPQPVPDTKRQMLRHTVATLAYRAGKVLRGAADEVPNFRALAGTRMPVEILAHVGDLLDWALALAKGKYEYHESAPVAWPQEIDRFFTSLAALDAWLASDEPLGHPAEKIFQGPIADALTHIGQIAMLRRLAGSPVRGESYFRAEISAGRVGAEQAAPVFEFD